MIENRKIADLTLVSTFSWFQPFQNLGSGKQWRSLPHKGRLDRAGLLICEAGSFLVD